MQISKKSKRQIGRGLLIDRLKERAKKVSQLSEAQRKVAIREIVSKRNSKEIMKLSENVAMPALHLVKPGDILASLNTKSWVSKGLAKANNSPYTHIGVFVGRDPKTNKLLIRDFRVGREGITRPFKEAHQDGMVYAIMRWEKATPQQLDSFLRNVHKIKGKYDIPLIAAYGINELNNYLGIKRRVNWDVESWFTCSEQFSHAADPPKKLIANWTLEPVNPPLQVEPGLEPNFVTPRIITVNGVNNKVLRIITMRKQPTK